MSNTFITVITIMIVAVLMFVVPVMTTANQNDNITQSSVQAMVSEFVNTAAREGKITKENYDSFIQKLYATGNTYSVDMEVQVFDENPGSKVDSEYRNTIGENIRYSEFTSSIVKEITDNDAYNLKQGDYIIAKVKNTNITMGTQIKNFIYSIIGKDTVAIEASASALVTVTGK